VPKVPLGFSIVLAPSLTTVNLNDPSLNRLIWGSVVASILLVSPLAAAWAVSLKIAGATSRPTPAAKNARRFIPIETVIISILHSVRSGRRTATPDDPPAAFLAPAE
jgi:hypothetical protein